MRQTASGTPFPAGSRVVHIGLPKTGTSTLQSALHRSRDELARHDVVYAGRRRHPKLAAQAALGQHRPWFPPGGDREWAEIVSQMRSPDPRCVLLSSEGLSSADPSTVRRLVHELGGQLQVLITLRPLAAVLASSWQQGLRNGLTTSLHHWCEELLSDPPASDHALAWRRRFAFHHYLETWGQLVGEDAVTYVVPDPTDRTMLIRVTEELLSLAPGTLRAVPSMNQSLPYPEAELLRHFAVAFRRAGGSEAAWMTSVGQRRTKTRLDELAARSEPHPIRVARWAAERANELTEPCLEVVRASGASVVGDLGHLVVDPARFEEETAPPRTVRIESAGEMAHVLYLAGVHGGGSRRRTARAAPRPDLDAVGGRELLRQLGGRVARRLRS